AAIQHPAMVTVHALGRWGDVDYLVMERVLGMSLEAHVQQRRLQAQPFSPAEVLDVLVRLADGLAAVHRFGISHRDVKPANIMLAPSERLVLMDFGLFCAQFDRSMVIAGTPEYIAPEVIAQRVAPGAWHLVDAYALGVVGY